MIRICKFSNPCRPVIILPRASVELQSGFKVDQYGDMPGDVLMYDLNNMII